MTDLLDLIAAAKERAEAGMKSSVDHADSDLPGWSERALELLVEYANGQRGIGDGTFLTEDAREYAYQAGLSRPPDDRAWGAVSQRARRQGLLIVVGAGSARSSNLSLKRLWKAV